MFWIGPLTRLLEHENQSMCAWRKTADGTQLMSLSLVPSVPLPCGTTGAVEPPMPSAAALCGETCRTWQIPYSGGRSLILVADPPKPTVPTRE